MKLTTTTLQVKASSRIGAMAEAEIKARETMPEARAINAVMAAGTTKVERASIDRNPALRRWDVVVELSLRADLIRQFGQAGAKAADAIGA